MKNDKKAQASKSPKAPRTHRVSLMFNDDEMKVIERYIHKYKVTNKARWYRETILTHVIRTLVDDYPTLFDKDEMR
ncbi:MAG: hypothetical protein LBL81_04605 [Tannerella sp.]|jgi:hypothetical protein|nr:hypothetical protein [Tannerella sp.]